MNDFGGFRTPKDQRENEIYTQMCELASRLHHLHRREPKSELDPFDVEAGLAAAVLMAIDYDNNRLIKWLILLLMMRGVGLDEKDVEWLEKLCADADG